MIPALAVSLAIAFGQAPPPVKAWQARYDQLIAKMKKRDTQGVIKFFHRDYSETADGVVYGLDHVKKQLPLRMETMARYGLKPKVLSLKEVGNTTTVSVQMGFRNVRTEKGKKAIYVGTSRLSDVWLKVGSTHQLYRSNAVSSTMTRNGKPFVPPSKPQ